jgi:2-polyprenyl-3-methyl-5-hydroxy-6-metoxy-1,4-benzoquinol methylase
MKSIFSRDIATYTENPDLLKWIKADPYNTLGQMMSLIDEGIVLDVGSGAGILGRLLQTRHSIIIDGIDPAISPDTPGVNHYRKFYQNRLEEIIEQPNIKDYDWFVLADVLEHLALPDITLKSLVAKGKPDAKFLISVPNVAHISARLELMNGHFEYNQSGIFESTHLRFFTYKTLLQVLSASGLSVKKILCLNRPHFPKRLLDMGYFRSAIALLATGNDSFPMAYQFLVVATQGVNPVSEIEHVGSYSKISIYKEYLQQKFFKLSS